MRIDNEYIYFEPNEVPKMNKKITGHSFVDLLGFNPYTKVGDALLVLHGIIKSQVDEKWLRRGDFAEDLVMKVYKRDFPNSILFHYKDKKAIDYDNFKMLYKDFGGIIDIEDATLFKIIEVKSKNIKDYEKIQNVKPLHEVYQGLFYAFLRGYEDCTMEWVFFDDESENLIFEGKQPKTLKNLKKESYPIKVNKQEMKQLCNKSFVIVRDFRKNLKIALKDISPKILNELKERMK